MNEYVMVIETVKHFVSSGKSPYSNLVGGVVIVEEYGDGTYSITEECDYCLSRIVLDGDNAYGTMPEITREEFMEVYNKAIDNFNKLIEL